MLAWLGAAEMGSALCPMSMVRTRIMPGLEVVGYGVPHSRITTHHSAELIWPRADAARDRPIWTWAGRGALPRSLAPAASCLLAQCPP